MGYDVDMIPGDQVVHVRLPAATIVELDRQASVDLRSRANLATLLIVRGLAESDDTNEED
jgi:hypothetical protein